MKPKDVVWELDAHSHGKHEVLRRYLTNAWFPILGSFAQHIAFIDGFAGPGEYKRGEKGSPLIAIEAFAPHVSRVKEATFLFIEEDPERAAHLKSLVESQQHPANCRILFETADFNQHMTRLLDRIGPGRQLAPAFVMVDPFGVSDTPMSLFSKIMLKTRRNSTCPSCTSSSSASSPSLCCIRT